MLAINDQPDIDVDRQQVLHSMGYSSRHKPSSRVTSLVDENIKNARHLIDPSYSYIVKNVEAIRRSCVFIEDSIVFNSTVMARLMKQCKTVAIFLATIGDRLEERVLHLAEDNLVLEASVLDTIGSVATQNVAEFVEGRIAEMAHAQGLCTSQRFSPGYCDWAIRQQKMIFRAMNGSLNGIRLNKECLMFPRKSLSGVIGIGPQNMEIYNPCQTCNKRDCLGRR